MRFTEIKEVPHFIRGMGARQKELMEFVRMDVKCVKVTFAPGEYKTTYIAGGVLRKSAQRAGLPIEVKIRKGDVYLIRTDM